MAVVELDVRAVYAEALLSLVSHDGQDVRTVPLGTFDPVGAMDLLEVGFGDAHRVEGLGIEALDDALTRNGWGRVSDWSEEAGERGPSASVRRVEQA